MKPETPDALTAGRSLVTALREQLQAETGQPVSLVETHISWVLLTERLAYKLKKPVQLSFVDFSTLAARKHFCDEELRLNRRLAPALYLDVVAVRGSPDAPRLDGGGEPIEYAVRMRRFPEDCLLRNLLLTGKLQAPQLSRFADRLAAFHAQAEVAPLFSEFGAPEQVVRPMREALAGLPAECGAERLQSLLAWIAERSESLRTAWLERQRQRAVRECHGDLHLANVVLVEDQLIAFDCIEFDPALRWIDVMNDVAFLTMDLKAHGRADLAYRFLDAYLQQGGDYAGLAVLRAYEVYRALVRARVGVLRAQALGDGLQPSGPDYLGCAEALAAPNAAPAPRLLITHGLSGSGKSTVARELLALAGAVRIRSDVERKRLFGLAPLQRSAEQSVDIYTPEATRRTFDRLAACARTALQSGYPVIVDAAFLRRDERMAFRALAAELRVPFSILHCQAADAQLRRRVAARGAGRSDASEADLAVLERQLASHEPLDGDERAITLDVDTEATLDAAALRARWLARSR